MIDLKDILLEADLFIIKKRFQNTNINVHNVIEQRLIEFKIAPNTIEDFIISGTQNSMYIEFLTPSNLILISISKRDESTLQTKIATEQITLYKEGIRITHYYTHSNLDHNILFEEVFKIINTTYLKNLRATQLQFCNDNHKVIHCIGLTNRLKVAFYERVVKSFNEAANARKTN
jgi:hypothetical protein